MFTAYPREIRERCFADTSYWVALTNIDDPANGHALNLSRSFAPDTSIEIMPFRLRPILAKDPQSTLVKEPGAALSIP